MMKTLCLLVAAFASAPGQGFAQQIEVSAGYSQFTRANPILAEVNSDNPLSPFFHVVDLADNSRASGWFGEVAGNVTRHAAIVGYASGNYASSTSTLNPSRGHDTAYSLLGGPGFSSHCCRGVVPFGQILVGVIHTAATMKFPEIQGVNSILVPERTQKLTDNHLALTVGGGANVRLCGPVGLQVAADVMRSDSPRQGKKVEWTPRFRSGLTIRMR